MLSFAEAYKMNMQVAYRYLKQYGGIDFLQKNWWALHTDNEIWAVRDIYEVCKNNGGLRYREHAEDWATKMANKYKKAEGFITEFNYTESDFARRICKIKHFDDYNHEWLDFVVMNRDKTLQLLKHSLSNEINLDIIDINEQLIEQLINDKQIDEIQATDIFYNSEIFAQLADETTEFYKRTWQEIYEMLKAEIYKERSTK